MSNREHREADLMEQITRVKARLGGVTYWTLTHYRWSRSDPGGSPESKRGELPVNGLRRLISLRRHVPGRDLIVRRGCGSQRTPGCRSHRWDRLSPGNVILKDSSLRDTWDLARLTSYS